MFTDVLKSGNIDEIRSFPKADLHNHFVLGGSREYIFEKTGYDISPIFEPLKSMSEMDAWSARYIGNRFNSSEGRKLLIEATFAQAKRDGVKVLEIGEDVWGLGEFFRGDIEELISSFQEANDRIAPEIELRLQIGMSRHCPIDYLEDCLSHFWGHKEFYSIDLYGDEMAQPIENFIPIYEKAAENGLVLKAHVGEWGTAQDIVTAVNALHLDEVQHGIAAVQDEDVMDFLVENNIRLNITPSSNVLLGRVADMAQHPIAQLYRRGVDVTVNSDDVLIFDSDVSKEYLRLYESGCLTAEELDDIRQKGLRRKEKTMRIDDYIELYKNGGYIKEMRKHVGHAPIMTCSCGVIIENDNGEILLQKRQDNGCWAIIGGAMEMGETFEEAVKRETMEEAGLSLGKLEVFQLCSGRDCIIEYPNGDICFGPGIVFFTREFEGEIVNNPEEVMEHRFFKKSEIPDNLNKYDKDIILEWAGRK